jgi:hypothetical protein
MAGCCSKTKLHKGVLSFRKQKFGEAAICESVPGRTSTPYSLCPYSLTVPDESVGQFSK